MNSQNKRYKETSLTILMAEDDPDDRFLITRAFHELDIDAVLCFVEDGEELMHYLFHNDKPADSDCSQPPALILLDLNMPKKDGREVLLEIRANPHFRELPVVVWTTSDHEEDMTFCHENGANSYVTKPHSYTDLVETVRTVISQWLPLPTNLS